MNETILHSQNRELLAAHELLKQGFTPLGNFLFCKNEKVYDLSAADLSQMPLIEEKGLFVVNF